MPREEIIESHRKKKKEVRIMPFFKWTEMERERITPKYSPAEGPTVRGEKVEVGLYFYPGGGKKGEPHSHPNEQVRVILRGKALFCVGNEERIIGPGDVVLIPPNVEHWGQTIEDLEAINVKDVVPGWSVKNAQWEK
jgi:quercetin dioxygenase-like cupin family protein